MCEAPTGSPQVFRGIPMVMMAVVFFSLIDFLSKYLPLAESTSIAYLAPFSYSQLIWVTLLSYIAFGDFPDAWSLAGIAILVASGIYTATHQRISNRLLHGEQINVPPSA